MDEGDDGDDVLVEEGDGYGEDQAGEELELPSAMARATVVVEWHGLPGGYGAEKGEWEEETLAGAARLKGARAPLASTSVRELTRWSMRFSKGKRRPGKRSRWP